MSGGRQKRPDLRALIALCCCLAWNSQAETFSAKVIAVIDGDTVLVLREGGGKGAGYPPASPCGVGKG